MRDKEESVNALQKRLEQERTAKAMAAAQAGAMWVLLPTLLAAIYFLLKAGENSHWHRVDAVEIWHYYAGAPLIVSISQTECGPSVDNQLGPDLTAGQSPQVIVPEHHWQSARTTGDYTLVGCTVSPAFLFEGFELAEPGFDIP